MIQIGIDSRNNSDVTDATINQQAMDELLSQIELLIVTASNYMAWKHHQK